MTNAEKSPATTWFQPYPTANSWNVMAMKNAIAPCAKLNTRDDV
jgi:hypothetical protein